MGSTVALAVLAVLVSETLAASPAAAQSQESGFVPVSPARILDTRDDTHGDLSSPIGGDTAESTTVTGVGGVPADASAVAINVTAVRPSRGGYLTIYPTGESRPLAASINFPAGEVVGNQINVKVGSGGQVDIYNYQGSIDVVFDVVGYYQDQRVETLESTVSDQATDIASLESTVSDQAADISSLESTVSDQAAEISSLESTVSDQGAELSALQTLLAGVSRQDDAQGRDTLTFAGMNLRVVNGTDSTDGTPNGLGNLIIGYDAERGSGSDKSGSHYLVVGDEHNYTAFGGILAGFRNTATGHWASVTGGYDNDATGDWASVSGGRSNVADGSAASVSGGYENDASGFRGSVSGGSRNEASGGYASVSGGRSNIADSTDASVSGGSSNTAGASSSSVSGGSGNTVSASGSSVSGGSSNTVDGYRSSLLGGSGTTLSANYSCHPTC